MFSRKIASNLLWTPQGLIRRPLVEIARDGRVLSVGSCSDPDRLPFVEFRAGLLVPDFPEDFRAAFRSLPAGRPLFESLPPILSPGGGILVVISGLDYETLRLTAAARIEKA
ncbi:MAG: cytosine deaminase [Alistipes sp.]|nr:cytosine deaminase [Alistipes senegalensis]MCM1250811.1 cytosine deaminase [Alistipes sp.]